MPRRVRRALAMRVPRLAAPSLTPEPVSAEVVRLTPDLAAAFLRSSAGNRPIRAARIRAYADTIARGEWRLNGETIVFDQDGQLRNGHHRCHAVILANTPIDVLVARGVAPDTFATFDRHARRSTGELLAMQGERRYFALAAALRHLHFYLTDRTRLIDASSHITAEQTLATLAEHPGIRPSVERAASWHVANRILAPSLVIFGDYAMTDDPDHAAEFWHALDTGANLTDTSPIYHLRKRLLDNAASSRKLPIGERYVLLAKTWSFYFSGRMITSGALRWRRLGPNAEPVPIFDPGRFNVE